MTTDSGSAALPELLVVMPAYNEEDAIQRVVEEWMHELTRLNIMFVLLLINDGSTGGTKKKIEALKETYGDRLWIQHQSNQGHGSSCVKGYQKALDLNVPYVFQSDSDGQCNPKYFHKLWQKRTEKDVVIGYRWLRSDGLNRMAVTMGLRLFLLVFARTFCRDANSPYRLMRSTALNNKLQTIPGDFFLKNVAVLLRKDKTLTHGYVPITFGKRYGGEPTVHLGTFLQKAAELQQDLRQLLKKNKISGEES